MTSKIVRFTEAYSLEKWMKGKTDYMPGLRCGIVKAPPDLLNDIIQHFSSLANRRTDFLTNVTYLERKLKHEKPDKWADCNLSHLDEAVFRSNTNFAIGIVRDRRIAKWT